MKFNDISRIYQGQNYIFQALSNHYLVYVYVITCAIHLITIFSTTALSWTWESPLPGKAVFILKQKTGPRTWLPEFDHMWTWSSGDVVCSDRHYHIVLVWTRSVFMSNLAVPGLLSSASLTNCQVCYENVSIRTSCQVRCKHVSIRTSYQVWYQHVSIRTSSHVWYQHVSIRTSCQVWYQYVSTRTSCQAQCQHVSIRTNY